MRLGHRVTDLRLGIRVLVWDLRLGSRVRVQAFRIRVLG